MDIDARLEAIRTKDKVAVLTAYDYSTARFCEHAGLDIILVGDSVAMVVQGQKDTKSVTMDAMVYHTEAVARGATETLIIGDMPIHSYDTPGVALANARRFLQAGAHGVKIEGNRPAIVGALRQAGVPVMGHIGLLPQTAASFKVQGKDEPSATQLVTDAKTLDAAGVFALVLECLPMALAKTITDAVACRTIGIGAGPHCDGQVLVINDMLGLYDAFRPRFARRYAELGQIMLDAIQRYRADVENGAFPNTEESYT